MWTAILIKPEVSARVLRTNYKKEERRKNDFSDEVS